jgi:hypothetical protein
MNAQSVSPVWHVYVRKGIAYVPNTAQAEAGFFLDVEPVRVATLDDIQSLAVAIEQAMSSGNPRVPTPTRADYSKPLILKDAGVKTWKAFERIGACFTILGRDEITLFESGRDQSGAWVDDPALTETLPVTTSALDLAKRIAERSRRRDDLA